MLCILQIAKFITEVAVLLIWKPQPVHMPTCNIYWQSQGFKMQTRTLGTLLGQRGEHVHLPVKKIIPLHVKDYVFIWDYSW